MAFNELLDQGILVNDLLSRLDGVEQIIPVVAGKSIVVDTELMVRIHGTKEDSCLLPLQLLHQVRILCVARHGVVEGDQEDAAQERCVKAAGPELVVGAEDHLTADPGRIGGLVLLFHLDQVIAADLLQDTDTLIIQCRIGEVHTMMLGISSRTRHEELAWEFCKLLSIDEEVQRKLYTHSHGISPLRAVAEDPELLLQIHNDIPEKSGFSPEMIHQIMSSAVVAPRFNAYSQALIMVEQAIQASADSQLGQSGMLIAENEIDFFLNKS